MKDIVIGGGEIGSTIAELLPLPVEVRDIDIEKRIFAGGLCEILHVCIPWTDSFHQDIVDVTRAEVPEFVLVHSTVPRGTTKKLQESIAVPVVYSPILGRHESMLVDLQYYVKFYSSYRTFDIDKLLQRFEMITEVKNPETLELAKTVETTYIGLLIAFRKMVDSIADFDEDVWCLSQEANRKHGDRPILYNDGNPIGGHCIMPNLDLLPEGFRLAEKFIKEYGTY